MKNIKTFEEFTGALREEAIPMEKDSNVIIDDVTLDSGEVILSTEIKKVILDSKTEKEFKEYFYEKYGNGAFTEEDIFTLITFFGEYNREKAEEEREKEKEKEEREKNDLGDLDI